MLFCTDGKARGMKLAGIVILRVLTGLVYLVMLIASIRTYLNSRNQQLNQQPQRANFITALIIGGAVAGGMAAGGAFSGGGGMPKITSPAPKTTAAKVATSDLTEAAMKNRRMAASALTADWGKPILGTKSLFG